MPVNRRPRRFTAHERMIADFLEEQERKQAERYSGRDRLRLEQMRKAERTDLPYRAVIR